MNSSFKVRKEKNNATYIRTLQTPGLSDQDLGSGNYDTAGAQPQCRHTVL